MFNFIKICVYATEIISDIDTIFQFAAVINFIYLITLERNITYAFNDLIDLCADYLHIDENAVHNLYLGNITSGNLYELAKLTILVVILFFEFVVATIKIIKSIKIIGEKIIPEFILEIIKIRDKLFCQLGLKGIY